MAISFNGSPYYNRFDPAENRTFVLFNPDVPLQQSELNESQSILHYYLQTFGDSIFKDGDKQTGLDYTIDENNNLKVNKGKVYINGKVRTYDSDATVTLSGVGTEIVGLKIEDRIITSDDDSRLLDPTNNVASYFSKGADRYEEKLVLTVNDPLASPIYTFKDGELFLKENNPEFDKINKVLAERTFDESGSYKVSGFDIYSSEQQDESTNMVNVVIDSGNAYVYGYHVQKPTSTRLQLEKSTETRLAQNESNVFNQSQNRVRLANKPVKVVDRVSASVRNKVYVQRGTVGDGVDYLPNSGVYEIEKIWTESSPGVTNREYKQGTDFNLIDSQAIDWSPSGQEPNGGTTYWVQYKYTRTMEKGNDYTVVTEGDGANKEWYINFINKSVRPLDQSVVRVDYTYYLARKDLIVLDKEGNITALKGEPNISRLALPPLQQDPYSLKLGYVTLSPNSTDTECVTDAITRLSMESLQKMKARIDNLEYNQAINALDDEAMEGQNPVTLRSVFSEGFISLDKADITHPDFGVAFSFDDAQATLQYVEAVNQPNISNNSNAHTWGRIVTAPFKETLELSQPLASETLNVNPYNIPNKQGVLKITPSEDNWIDRERITVTEQATKKVTLNRWWRHPGRDYGTEQETLRNKIVLDGNQTWEGHSYAYDRKHGRTGTMLSSGGTRTLEEMIEFIRPRDIEIFAKGLNPNDNNLYLLFDGVRCPLTPKSGYLKGSETGTVRTDSKGQVKATFTIPPGIKCGTREVTLKNDNSTSATSYTAQGRKKITEDVIIRTRVTVNLVDPLAQSFQFDESKVLSSVGVYFASKGQPSSNVTVQIRGMGDQGYPNKIVYAETVLNASDIKVSNNGLAETRVYFDDPIMLDAGKEYAIVVITENSDYTMWTATRNQPRIDKPNQVISGNPYVNGVLFSSSNSSTWTPHQNSDMKFNIYTATFNETGVIEFDSLNDITSDRFVAMATYLTPQNTGCNWEAKILFENASSNVTIDTLPWQPIGSYQDIELNGTAKEIKLRATFKANKYISPMLSVSDLVLTTFLTNLSGAYISRGIDMTDAPFNHLRLSYEAFLPNGTKATPQYSVDNGSTWNDFKVSPSQSKANNEFVKYTIDEKVNSNSTYDNLKLRVNLSTQNSFLRPRIRRLMSTTRNE